MIPAAILGTGSAVPSRAVTTRELLERALPHRDPVEMERRIGIDTRYWAGPDETAASLGAIALARALDAAKLRATDLRRIIFVSSTGGDALIPSTANAVAEALGIPAGEDDTCDAFDVNNSCAGFVTAVDLASRSVATGLGPVGVVSSEIFSRYVAPSKPRPYLVLGDAAGAVVVGAARDGEGLIGSFLSNNAALRGRMTTQHPGVTHAPAIIDFQPSSAELTDSAFFAMSRSASRALADAEITLDDVEHVLPHQPNGEMLAHIVERMAVPAERLVPVVREVGSVGSASIPFSLDRLARSGRLGTGDRVLMLGVGSGTAYGALLYQHGRRGERSQSGILSVGDRRE